MAASGHSKMPTDDRSPTKLAGVVVAGHVCLDVIPTFPKNGKPNSSQIQPGRLYQMGPAVCATGGAVSNTGLALHKLGIPTSLMGKVADDLFGDSVLSLFRRIDPSLCERMLVVPGESTSYSVVISPPEVDRSFLHFPGANDTFSPDDIPLEALKSTAIFHFGYPPLMLDIYRDGGEKLARLFAQLQSQGTITSLDMSMPDPQSEAGQVNWREFLARVLPTVDLYVPSIEETLFMLDRPSYDRLVAGSEDSCDTQSSTPKYSPQLLESLSEQLIGMGAGTVVLKLGEQGLYLRSSERAGRLGKVAANLDRECGERQKWENRELMTGCFRVEVVGTTGAGDATIAGLLAGVAKGLGPVESLRLAVAVGATCVEAADATSGISNLKETQDRIQSGWERLMSDRLPAEWKPLTESGVWRGPHDLVPHD